MLRVPLAAMVPDEDEVHFALSCHFAEPMGFDEMSDDAIQYATTPWSIDIARHALKSVAECFKLDDAAVEQAAVHLNAIYYFVACEARRLKRVQSFKGTVIIPFGFDNETSGIEIIGYGTTDDPFESYSNFDSYLGTELSLDPDFINEAQYSRQAQALTG